MLRAATAYLAIVFLNSSLFAKQNQTPSVPPQTHAAYQAYQALANSSRDCSASFAALQGAKQAADREAHELEALSDSSGEMTAQDAASITVDPRQDFALVDQNQRELARCILAMTVQAPVDGSANPCSAELLWNFELRHDGEPEGDIPIARLPGTTAFFYAAGMTIDADGAPNAYHPENIGLDDLANAGTPGIWQGLAKDSNGQPYIQGPNDPFPGYYVSETALADRSKAVNDPTRWVDASKIPFVVLPGGVARRLGARPGDFAVVFNQRNSKSSYAIFADVGPFDRIGEGSMALAENLGIRSDARNGGARRGILYLVFPGSGNARPRTVEEINSEGQKLLQEWGGSIPSGACAVQQTGRMSERDGSSN